MTPLDLSSLRGVSWKTTITKLLGDKPSQTLNNDKVFSFCSDSPLYLGNIPLDSITGANISNSQVANSTISAFAIQVLNAKNASEANAINPIVIYSPLNLLTFDYDWLEDMPSNAIGGANVLLLVPAHSGRNTYVSYYWGNTVKSPSKIGDKGINFFALGGYIGTTILQQLAQFSGNVSNELSGALFRDQLTARWDSLDLPDVYLSNIERSYYSGASEAYNVLKAESFNDPRGLSDLHSVGVLLPNNNLIFPSSDDERLLQAKSIPNQSVTKTGNNTMKLSLAQIIEQNKDSAIQAGKLEAGRTVNQQLGAVMAKSLPLMVRGYAQTELGHLVVANLFLLAVQNFASDNKVAMALAESAVNSASYELLRGLDIPKLIDDVVKGVPSAQLSNLLTKGEE